MADLTTIKRSLGAFAQAIGRAREDWQLAAGEMLTRITMLAAGRQLGKSELLAIVALWRAFREREHLVLVISASDHAARRLLALAATIAQGSEFLRGSVIDQQRGLIRLSNGSTIRSVAASEAAVRGWSVDTLLIDEAALLPGELIVGAALPTMTARPNARAILASSATTAAGPFFDMFRAGEVGSEHIRSFRWVAKVAGGDCDAPWVSASSVEVDRAAMSGIRFAAEHQAQFAGGGDSLFTLQGLARVTVDYEPDALGSMVGPARVFAGVDWGATNDRSALVAIGRLPVSARERIFGVRCAHRWEAGALLPSVYGEIAASPAAFLHLASETNGLGIACTQELWAALERRPYVLGGGRPRQGVVMVQERGDDFTRPRPKHPPRPRFKGFVTEKVPVTTSVASKAATWSAIRLLIDKGQLLLPASASDLIRELQLLRIDLTPGGNERIEASVGHDDLADALYLAAIPYRLQRGGGWRSSLTDAADLRNSFPMVQAPPQVQASPHVPGPDGLMVPARPAWQSIAGAELTVPEGLDFAPVDPRMRETQRRVQGALAAD
jgi:hypothetical protein